MNRTTTWTLKSKIKGLTEEKMSLARARKKHKHQSPGNKQADGYQEWFVSLDFQRAMVRYEIRCNLLAYAYARGRVYRDVERNCAEDRKLCEEEVEVALRAHGYYPFKGKVRAWLDVPAEDSSSEDIEEAA